MVSLERVIPILLASLLAGGCAQSGSSPALAASQAVPAIPRADAARAANAATVLPGGLRNGEDFAQARKTIIAAGWLPLENRDACAASLGEGMTNACRPLPEVHGCDAATAQCQLRYAKVGASNSLNLLVTRRDPQDADAIHLDRVVSFTAGDTIEVAARPQAGAACPSTDFRKFLQAFAAADASERLRLSEPLLRATRIVDDELAPESPREVLVPATSDVFEKVHFLLGFTHGKFQSQDSTGEALGPIEPLITAKGADVMHVTFVNDVEGEHYVFLRKAGCWRWAGRM